VFSGALKASSGYLAKTSIVEGTTFAASFSKCRTSDPPGTMSKLDIISLLTPLTLSHQAALYFLYHLVVKYSDHLFREVFGLSIKRLSCWNQSHNL